MMAWNSVERVRWMGGNLDGWLLTYRTSQILLTPHEAVAFARAVLAAEAATPCPEADVMEAG